MAEENQENGLQFDLPKNRSSVIKVIGVGGGGSNAVNHMKEMGIKGVDFMVCNTDAQALEHSLVENRIQLGSNLTEGLGAGANPEVGREAAEESLEEIREVLKNNTRMVFITAGMGGGTGTGAAPVIAKLAREMNILTVGIVTKPFHFEGKIRSRQADEGIEELRQHVDSLVVINNDKLREVYGNLTFRSGFAKADEVLATAAKGIAEVITYHYTTNIDLRDVRTVLENSGTAIMGSSTAKGTDRAKLAVTQALDSPLLNDNHINGAKNVLLLIVSGTGKQEITMDEMGFINEHIQDEAGGNANVILGVGIDESLADTISVTVIATGFPTKRSDAISGRTPEKIVHSLEPDQPISKALFERPFNEVENPDKRQKIARPSGPDLFSAVDNDAQKVHDLYEEEEVEEEIELVNEVENKLNEEISAEIEVDEELENELAELEDDFEIEDEELEIEAEIEIKAEEENEVEADFEIEDEDDFGFEINEEDVAELAAKLNADLAENEVSFELDDIKGEGIKLTAKSTEKAPDAKNEETEYDPFDFRIEDVMSAPMAKTTVEAEDNIDEVEEEEIAAIKVEEPKIVRHTLEDLRELESRLQIKKPVQEEQKVTAEAPETISKINEEEEELLHFEVKQAAVAAVHDAEIDEDILNRPIGPASYKKIMERRERLQAFQHTFKPRMAQMLEREPAYKRQGLDLGAGQYSTTKAQSSMTISGEGNETEIKTNNSFLHDNVD